MLRRVTLIVLLSFFCNAARAKLSKEMQMLFPPALAEGWTHSFVTDPYISPYWIDQLAISSVATSDYFEKVTVVNMDVHHVYAEGKYEGSSVELGEGDEVYTTWYRFVGKTDHGIYVLQTYKDFLFLAFEKDQTHFDGRDEERISIKRMGEYYFYPSYVEAHVKGNKLYIDKKVFQSGCIYEEKKPYKIDLSVLKPPTISPPDHTDVTSWNALHAAVEHELFSDLEEILKLGSDINELNAKKQTPLMVAKEEKTALFLLRKGANPHLLDIHQRSALHYALERRHHSLVHALLLRGVDVNQVDDQDQTPLFLASEEEIAFLLLENGADPHKGSGYPDGTYGSLPFVKALIERGVEGAPLLSLALKSWDKEMAEFLFHQGARPSKDQFYDAIKTGSIEIVDFLLSEGCVEDQKALFCAASHGHLELVQRFLKEIDAQNEKGKTLLMVASDAVAHELLKQGANPFLRDQYGRTALHHAIYKSLSFMRQLIEKGVDLNLRGYNDTTPLILATQWAERIGEQKALFLLEQGADPHVADKYERTALHYALEKNQKRLIAALIEKEKDGRKVFKMALRWERKELVEDLFAKGVPALEEDLSTLASMGVLDIVKDLIKKGASPDPSPLYWAVKHCQCETVQFLLDTWGYLEYSEEDPLIHIAVEEKSLDILNLLLEHGADPHVRTWKGTPLDLAIDYWEVGAEVLRQAVKTSQILDDRLKKFSSVKEAREM